MFLLAPALILAGLTGAAAWRAAKRPPKVMTPEQHRIYEAALLSLKEPAKLRTLAATFAKAGFPAEAEVLRKRAALRELPAATKQARAAVFRKAAASLNPQAVKEVAAAFAAEGCYGAASRLHEYADSLLCNVLEAPLPAQPEAEAEDSHDAEA